MEILKYTLPALLVLIASIVAIYMLLKEERERREFELKKKDRNITTPIRLRGCERLTLLLERITPEHLLMNVDISTLSIPQLQRQLLQTVRLEFDHNLSQQVYVSDETWAAIVLAKEETLRFINAAVSQLPPESNTLQYAQLLITAYNTNGVTPTQRALELLKEETRTML